MTPGRRLASGAGLVLVGLASALASAQPATATVVTPGEPVHERTIVLGTDATTIAPFAVDRLAPGSSVSQPLRLHLAGDILSGRPAVRIDHVRDLERGCVHPESAAGDITCGSGDDQGELSSQLLAGVTWHAGDANSCATVPVDPATATVAAVAGVTQAAAGTAAVGAADTCVVLTLTLPSSADNLVQSDSVLFDLQVGLLDVVHRGDLTAGLRTGPVAGSGTGLSTLLPPAAGGSLADLMPNPVLPFTGLRLLPFALLTMGLTVTGLGAVSLSRPRVPAVT